MARKDLGFWVATGLFCAIMAVGGLGNLLASEFQVRTYESLGYPLYPTFDMLGAFASHAFAGSALAPTLMPLVVLSVALTSYALRPASRRLQGDAGGPLAAAAPGA